MVDESVLRGVREYLRALQAEGLAVRFGVLFGSHATGQPGPWSDIDLLVVSPQFDHLKDRRLVGRLWRIAARIDSRIEPIPCGQKRWEEDDSSALIEIARRQGVRVSASG
ncbi:MAG: nucleotidyltransferase domain-containing protein [Acidobacteria bacterium]|nr:nucleotidyltransferase domain-containing protein [Acidobacteriota bacterium]